MFVLAVIYSYLGHIKNCYVRNVAEALCWYALRNNELGNVDTTSQDSKKLLQFPIISVLMPIERIQHLSVYMYIRVYIHVHISLLSSILF